MSILPLKRSSEEESLVTKKSKQEECIITSLSAELLVYLCSFLNANAFRNFQLTCKAFAELGHDPSLCSLVYARTFYPDHSSEQIRRSMFFLKEPTLSTMDIKINKDNFLYHSGTTLFIPDFESSCLQMIDLDTPIRSMLPLEADESIGKSSSFFPIVNTNSSKFSIWDTEGKCHRVIEHSKKISSFAVSESKIVVASAGKMCVYELTTGHPIFNMSVLKTPDELFWGTDNCFIQKSFPHIFSERSSKEMYSVWQISPVDYNELHHAIDVRFDLIIHNPFIFGVSSENTILKWTLPSAECRSFGKLTSANFTALCAFDSFLVISSYQTNSIQVWDFKKETLYSSLIGHRQAVLTAKLNECFLFSFSYDTLKVWDYHRGTCIRTIVQPDESIVEDFKILENRYICCRLENDRLKILHF